MSERVPPGATALIVMPFRASSGARLVTMAETAALLAAYRLCSNTAIFALTDDVSTIRPPSPITAAAAWAANSWPATLMPNTRWKSAMVIDSSAPKNSTPALLTRMSRPPKAAVVWFTSPRRAAGSLTSACSATAPPPSALSSLTRASAASCPDR